MTDSDAPHGVDAGGAGLQAGGAAACVIAQPLLGRQISPHCLISS